MAVLAFTLGGSIGCGEESLPEANACKEVASAMCDYIDRCAGAAGLQLLGYASVAACKSDMQSQCTTSSGACETGQTYNGTKAKECLDGFKGLSCTADAPAACDQVCQ